MPDADGPLRVALLTYRGNPHSGGQGVYVHYLSRELAALGHIVEVFSGPPYPELAPGVRLTEVPSLDLYRPEDPFRTPRRDEFRGAVDVLEFATMCCGAFPEPLTYSLRARRLLAARRGDFDVVHDNQCLGYGILGIAHDGLPVVATIHHPITVDRDLELAQAADWQRRMSLRRWYGFVRMQKRVLRRLPCLLTVSESSARDICRQMGARPGQVSVVPVGVDTDWFRPLPHVARVPGRLMTTASADVALKGLVPLLEALAKVRTERHAELVIVGPPRDGSLVPATIERLGLEGAVTIAGAVDAPAHGGAVRVGRGGGGAVAVRGLLAPGGGGHGLRRGPGQHHRRRPARGRRPPPGDRPAGAPRRPGGAGRGHRRGPRRRRPAPAAGHGRPAAGARALHVAGDGGGDRRALPAGRRCSPLSDDHGRVGDGSAGRPPATGCSTSAAAGDATPSRPSAGAPTWWPSTAATPRPRTWPGCSGPCGPRARRRPGTLAAAVTGDALALPFADASFDRLIAAEVLEHVPDDRAAIAELARVLRPGGRLAVTVPRWFPERVCWALSSDYHAPAVPDGHVRIYRRRVLAARLEAAGLRVDGASYAHALHSPYWWLRCLVGLDRPDVLAGPRSTTASSCGPSRRATGSSASRRARPRPGARQEPGALRGEAVVNPGVGSASQDVASVGPPASTGSPRCSSPTA